jgi:hypothetical protein
LNDPRPLDAFSLVYDSAPLNEEFAILGRPRALLQVSATAPLADWFVRLSDVAPDGTVTQITGAGMNGAHRDSMAEPLVLEPGKISARHRDARIPGFPEVTVFAFGYFDALWPMVLPAPRDDTSLELEETRRVPTDGLGRPARGASLGSRRQPSEGTKTSRVLALAGYGRSNATRPTTRQRFTGRGKAENIYP